MARSLYTFLLGVAALLIAAEGVLRLLPVSTATMTGYHHDAEVLTYPSHHTWQVSTGWDLRNPQAMASNNWGFVAPFDFVPEARAVALIGDSYVEASMLRANDRPGAQLQGLLGKGRSVYALGSPGTALLDYAQRVRLAAVKFGIRDFILLLEATDARQSLCGSGNVHSQCLDPERLTRRTERKPEAGSLKRIARHSALAQYVAGQLKFRPAELVRATLTRQTPDHGGVSRGASVAHEPLAAEDIARARLVANTVVDAFFADAQPYLLGRLVVVVDGNRDGPRARHGLVDIERQAMIDRLRMNGAVVVDLEPLFAMHAAGSARRLDVGPYDGHLNALGVEIAMKAAADLLQR